MTDPLETEDQFSSPLQFPCEFVVKIMGKAAKEFEESVFNILKKHFPDIQNSNISKRSSKGANYIALTATVNAQSQEQLDALYQDLSAEKSVLMAL